MSTQLDPISLRRGFSARPKPPSPRAKHTPADWRRLAMLPRGDRLRKRLSYDPMTFIHRLNIAAAIAAVVFVVILFAVRCVPLMLGECRVSPNPLPFKQHVDAVIELPRPRPCRIDFNSASAVVSELTLVKKPARGEVLIGDKGSVTYRPSGDFHGDDFFTVLARGTSIRRVDAALVDVTVNVH